MTNGTVNTKVDKTSYNGSYSLSGQWTVWNGGRNTNTIKLDQIAEQQADLSLKKRTIDKVITDDMDDYAKELAIHDFIVQNVTYDINMLGIFEDHGEHAADPYGALVDGKCICSGYTTTFNMFMDIFFIFPEIASSSARLP